ncbi:PH domain-containing protein [Geodermatophilus pulveris]|uniref:PH domain-containing protein n=1 Tax=Geodermatophilus pulveris TaxID=1564159 RepID=A0A239B5A7_9ACTN|nr:PH domain-containing protein [Geodermatophilus pulveris]SNS02404.1 PH domain-containing protein [Geodermatophilus pulveris]
MSEPAPGPAGGSRPVWSRDAEKYLLPEEQPPVVATRRHWAVLVGPVAKAVPVLAAGGWLLVRDPDDRVTASIGLVLLVGVLVFLALRIGEWWMRHFIVTKRRVLLTTGIVVRTVALLPLRRITDLTYKETLVGQLLGYGTFRFESAGQQQALSEITYLPRAGVLYRDVSDLLFGGGGADSGDDEGNPEPEQPAARGQRRPTGDGGPAPADTAPIRPSRPPARPRRVAGRRVRDGGR